MRADVTQEADIERLIAGCLKTWGRIDCLFNNAGGPAPRGGIESIPVDGFDAAMATHEGGRRAAREPGVFPAWAATWAALCFRTRLVFDCLRMTKNTASGPRIP